MPKALRRRAATRMTAAVLALLLPVQGASASSTASSDDWSVPHDYIDLVEQGWLENVSMVDYRWKYSKLIANGRYIGNCGCQNTVFATALNWFFPEDSSTVPRAPTPVHSWWWEKGPTVGEETVWSPSYVDAFLTASGGYQPGGGNGAGGCGTNAEPWGLAGIGAAEEVAIGGEVISAPTGLVYTVHNVPGNGGLTGELRSLFIKELEAGRPVAVMRAAPAVDDQGNPKLSGHGNVIVGYNPENERFLAVDPAWKRGAYAQEGAVRPKMNETYQEWEESILMAYTFEKAYPKQSYSTLTPDTGASGLRAAEGVQATADYHLAVTRPDGRRAGWDPVGERYTVSGRDFAHRPLDGASLVGDTEMSRGPERLYVSAPGAGTYRYEVHGVTGGGYRLALADEGGEEAVPRATLSGSVTAGGVVKVEAERAADGTTTTTVVKQFAPEPKFRAPAKVSTGERLDVDAIASFDADGEITDWSWDFGDGTQGHGRTASHHYEAPGEYDIRLTVADDAGASRSLTRHVTVSRSDAFPPVVRIDPAGDMPFQQDAFDVEVSATDKGRGVRTLTYEADGATTVPATTVEGGGPVTLRVSTEGRTTVTVRATDHDGNEAQAQRMVVGVDDTAPRSRVTTPLEGGSTSGLGIVAGAVSDAAAGGASVQVALTRASDGKSWDGAAWTDDEHWLAAQSGPELQDRWFLAGKLPSGSDLSEGGYRLRSRAVDAAGNAEAPGTGIAFTVTGSVLTPTDPTRLARNAGESFSVEAVDDDGVVVGRAGGSAARWDVDGTRETLPPLSGRTGGWARDILDGVAVGHSGGPARATAWQGGAARDLGTLPGGGASDAHGVDSHGVAVGYAVDDQGRRRPVRFTDAGVVPLAAPSGTGVAIGEARAVSPSGRYAAGFVQDAEGKHRAALWDGDTVTLFDELSSGVPAAVNDSGAVAGIATIQSRIHAVLWDASGAHDLGPGQATDIDNRGVVVGSSGLLGGSSPLDAAVWQDGSLLRLQDELPSGSGWRLTSGRAISRTSGSVVGGGLIDGTAAPFRMTVPTLTGPADRTPPQTAAEPDDEGWHSDDVEVTVRATDEGSGLAWVRTSATGDTEGDTAKVRITAEGVTELAYSAADKAGNTAPAGVVEVRIDRTAPTLVAAPASPDALAGDWSRGPVTVGLSAEDTLSGVEKLHVRVDDEEERVVTGAEGAVEVTGDGVHTVTAWAVDRAGNASAQRRLQVRIDGTAPTVTFGGASDGATVDRGATVAFTATDAGSGLAGRTVTYTVDGVATAEDGPAIGLRADGEHRIEVVATDAAGNTTTSVYSATVSGPSGPAAQLGDGPVAAAGGPYTARVGKPLRLDGSGSRPISGEPLSYAWQLPNTKDPVDAVRPTVTFDEPGQYLVSLEVSEGSRHSVPDWALVTVTGRGTVEQGGTAKAGRAIPLRFTAGGGHGTDVFSSPPVSVPSTADGTTTGSPEPARSPGSSGVTAQGKDRYQWVWKTDKAWAGTTRMLILFLRDGTVHRVAYRFR